MENTYNAEYIREYEELYDDSMNYFGCARAEENDEE